MLSYQRSQTASGRFEHGPRLLPAILAGAVTAVFCAGMLLRKPWLAQTVCWAILLPVSAWLAATPRFAKSSSALWLLIVGGTAAYFFVLLVSTVAYGLHDGKPLWWHVWSMILPTIAVVATGWACRSFAGFPKLFARMFVIASAIAGCLLLSYTVMKGLPASGRLEGDQAINYVLNPNAVGGVYAICFAVSLGHCVRRDVALTERIGTVLAAAVFLAVVFLTQSRGAILGCGVAIVIAMFALPLRFAAIVFATMIGVAGLIAIIVPDWVSSLLQRGDSYRLGAWRHFFQLAQERLWLGFGLDFNALFISERVPVYTPHNILLAALVRGGIPGLLTLLVTLLAALVASFRAAAAGWWLPAIVLTAGLSLSMVDHEIVPDPFSFYWYLFWLPLGLSAAAASFSSSPREEHPPA